MLAEHDELTYLTNASTKNRRINAEETAVAYHRSYKDLLQLKRFRIDLSSLLLDPKNPRFQFPPPFRRFATQKSASRSGLSQS